jgi:hypothetical protein
MTRRTLGRGLLPVLLLAACARPGSPPGGPEDLEPPALAGVEPDSDAVAVSPTAPLVLTFTEKVNERSLDAALSLSPPAVIRDIDTDGPVATVKLREPFPESTTVTVLVTTALADNKRNRIAEPIQWTFSTGPTLDPGLVAGRVETVGGSAQGIVLLALFAAGDTLPDPAVETPLALTQARSDGTYRLPGRPVDGRWQLLYAALDADRNREIGGQGEFWTAAPESVRITPERPVRRVDLRLVSPDAPGTVGGALARAAGDSSKVLVELYPAEDDSLRVAETRVTAKVDGAFSVTRVPPGGYRLVAFCDANDNGFRDLDEPWVIVLESVIVPAGGKVDLGDLQGPTCGP